jgi:hypothetical protein
MEAHARIRKRWVEAHLNWIEEQWFRVFWTYETWVRPGRHLKIRLTRRRGEALYSDCVELKVQKRIGWMFWGGVSRLYSQGPGLF